MSRPPTRLVRWLGPMLACWVAPQSFDPLEHDRRLGAAYFWENDNRRAAELLTKVALLPDATARDLLNAALAVAMRDSEAEIFGPLRSREAREWLARALEREPDLVDGLVLEAIFDEVDEKRPHAIATLERARSLAPADATVAALLGSALEEEGEIERAKPLLIDATRSDACFLWPSLENHAVRRLGTDDRRRTDERAYEAFVRRSREAERKLSDLGAMPWSVSKVGRLAWIEPPSARASPGVAPTRAPELHWQPGTAIPTRGRARFIDLRDLGEIFAAESPRDDVVVTDDAGIVVARALGNGRYESTRVALGDWQRSLAVSLEYRLDKSLLAIGRRSFQLFDPDGRGGFAPDLGPVDLGAEIGDVALVDLVPDEDQALDLLFATPRGLICFANRGVPSEHDDEFQWKSGPLRLEDASASMPGPAAPCAWIVVDDYDDDGRPDLLIGGPGAATRLLLHGVGDASPSALESASTGIAGSIATKPLAIDLDHDARPDLLLAGSPGHWQRNLGAGRFAAPEELSFSWTRPATVADVDRDGEEDLLTTDEKETVVARLGSLLASDAPWIELPGRAPTRQPPFLADVDVDGALDLLDVHDVGVLLRLGRPDPNTHSLHVRLRGPGAFDAGRNSSFVAWLHGRPLRRFVTTTSLVLGLGDESLPELIDVRWPAGDWLFFRREFAILDRSESKLPWEWGGVRRDVARIYQREVPNSGPPGREFVRFRPN